MRDLDLNFYDGHTPGPWEWVRHGPSSKIGAPYRLVSPGRGWPIVMDFARHGMNGAQPMFGTERTEKDRGGILVRANEMEVRRHPDAALMEGAPLLLAEVVRLRAEVERLGAREKELEGQKVLRFAEGYRAGAVAARAADASRAALVAGKETT